MVSAVRRVKVDVRAVVVKYHYSYRFFTYSVKRCRNLTSKNLTSKDVTFKSKANDLKIVLKDTLRPGPGTAITARHKVVDEHKSELVYGIPS